ncbi:hypothetical protein MTX78_00910 [Hymenobacter tibetensis]|uniref:PH domain-containing protein n=1 Tax=Hymenobacter tibetensis TaxID=497967 RepID=A0ABY4D5C5_9BACT|nr:hypothetical protein [Hymenobacter tibetensis]UOG75173.1 hypothetical protein MTX78_00910 [Hymenobacter tibetensis]
MGLALSLELGHKVWVRKDTGFSLEILLLLLGIGFFFCLPAITVYLHAGYRRHEQDAVLWLYPEEQWLEYHNFNETWVVTASDIKQITHYTPKNYKSLWKDYDYLALKMHNGQTIVITSLLIDYFRVLEVFPQTPQATVYKWINPLIPTSLNASALGTSSSRLAEPV